MAAQSGSDNDGSPEWVAAKPKIKWEVFCAFDDNKNVV